MTEIVEDDKFAACDVVMKTLRRFGRNHAVVPAPDDEGWQVQLSYAVGGSSRPALSGRRWAGPAASKREGDQDDEDRGSYASETDCG